MSTPGCCPASIDWPHDCCQAALEQARAQAYAQGRADAAADIRRLRDQADPSAGVYYTTLSTAAAIAQGNPS